MGEENSYSMALAAARSILDELSARPDMPTHQRLACVTYSILEVVKSAGNQRYLQAVSDNGPRYDYSAYATAEILNLHFDPSQPKPVLYRRILATILNAMNLAEMECREAFWEPGEN